MSNDALISECGDYRYWLTRDISEKKGRACFVMLNPSTADHSEDDPTIRRCKHFADSVGCGKMTVINLYAFRATSPKDMLSSVNPKGADNERWIKSILPECDVIICAWGNNARLGDVSDFKDLASSLNVKLSCLGVTKSNMPKHPLYLKSTTEILSYE